MRHFITALLSIASPLFAQSNSGELRLHVSEASGQGVQAAVHLLSDAKQYLYNSERINLRLQTDGQNLNNVLDVVDFGGLFSGNAIGPSRSYLLRLSAAF